jgi:hypothetical protein
MADKRGIASQGAWQDGEVQATRHRSLLGIKMERVGKNHGFDNNGSLTSQPQDDRATEGLAARSLNGKLTLFWREFILSVDSPGLIGVRRCFRFKQNILTNSGRGHHSNKLTRIGGRYIRKNNRRNNRIICLDINPRWSGQVSGHLQSIIVRTATDHRYGDGI